MADAEAPAAAAAAAAIVAAPPSDFTPIGSIGRRHGETNQLGYSLKTVKALALRSAVQRVNRHAYNQSGRVLGRKLRVIIRTAAGFAAKHYLKTIPVTPHLVKAASLHGVPILSPQYKIRSIKK